MNVSAERSKSYWQSTTVLPKPARLESNQKTEVVVIGAGIAGLSVAYELAAAGKAVVVLDRGILANGMTARTSAHLASHIDDGFADLIRLRGEEEARLHYRSHSAAIDRIEAIVKAERINCDFARVDGYLVHDLGTDLSDLESEYRASMQVGFDGAEWLSDAAIAGVQAQEAIRYPRQARFHPLLYCYGLVDALLQRGVSLYGETVVSSLKENASGVFVGTSDGLQVLAQYAVVATNSPINDVLAVHTKQAPYRTYVFSAEVPKGGLADALFWDTADPYHYVRLVHRPEDATDIVLVGGADHKSGTADDVARRFIDLELWARKVFPSLGSLQQRWSGQVLEPVDYGAFIGLNPGAKRVFIATGDSGQGLTHGAIAGMLIRDTIAERANEWRAIYDPRRKSIRALPNFVRENATVVANMTERITGGEIASVRDLKPGQGATIRQGMSIVAAYRAESGRLYVRSASCTHAGCIVHWNGFEKCWDCPCHGSQFAPDGTALNAPAVAALAEVEGFEDEALMDPVGVLAASPGE